LVIDTIFGAVLNQVNEKSFERLQSFFCFARGIVVKILSRFLTGKIVTDSPTSLQR
jgi:hypothetical protein